MHARVLFSNLYPLWCVSCSSFFSLSCSSWCLFLLVRFVCHRIFETTLRHLKMNLHFFRLCFNVHTVSAGWNKGEICACGIRVQRQKSDKKYISRDMQNNHAMFQLSPVRFGSVHVVCLFMAIKWRPYWHHYISLLIHYFFWIAHFGFKWLRLLHFIGAGVTS